MDRYDTKAISGNSRKKTEKVVMSILNKKLATDLFILPKIK